MEKKQPKKGEAERELSEEELVIMQLDAFEKATQKFQSVLGALGNTVAALGTRLESLEKKLEILEKSDNSESEDD